MRKVIYYFSGTGNSLRATHRIAEALGDTEIISMRSDPINEPAKDAEMIGFVFPVYHWTMPDAVISFIKELRMNPEAYVFGVSTLIYINCHSFEVLDSLLQEKGAHLAYARTLPSVGFSLNSYTAKPNPDRRVPKSEEDLTRICTEVKAREKRKYPKANFLTRMIYPTRTKYIQMLPESDKGFAISEKCTGCSLCTRVCPRQNIVLENGRPVFRHQCCSCMGCVAYCPAKAINYQVTRELREKYPFHKFSVSEEEPRYHNPFVSSADMSVNSTHID